MNMDERGNVRELQPTDLRGILKYVPLWRNHVFVVALDGSVTDDDSFGNLMLEIAVLRNLSIHVVIVYGIGNPLQALAAARGVAISDTRGYGATDAPTLDLAVEAAGLVGHRIAQGLTQNGLKCASGNVVRATERGVIKGVDQKFTGKVERVDTELLRQLLAQEIVPLIGPVQFSREGQPYRLNSDLLASEVAIALQASKLIYLMPCEGLTVDGQFKLNVDVAEVKDLLAKRPESVDERVRSKAVHAVRTIEGGTPRAHIIDSRIHDGLLMEIFSKVGIGSMIHSNPYARIRPARKKDVAAIFSITKGAVRDEALRLRSRATIERDIGAYFVYEIDDSIIGCARLTEFPDSGVVELGSVFVQPAYQGRNIGKILVDYALQQAKERGIKRVIALTTQAFPFFRNTCGFTEGALEDLPEPLRSQYETNGRNSRILVREP